MSNPPPASQQPQDTILARTQTIAVVGLSDRPNRPSYRVSRYMQQHGYRIIPVNPEVQGAILGEPVVPSLADLPRPVDLVNIFRRPHLTDAPIDGAIEIGAPAVWLQLGITNAPGLQRARDAGLLAVHDLCLMIEHRRWIESRS